MAIKIFDDRIQFGNSILSVTPTGLSFNGKLYSQGFNSSNASFQGFSAGYGSGGGPPGVLNVIDRFPFTQDTSATDAGDLTQARIGAAGQSSSTRGYTSGGFVPSHTNTIDSFPFASISNATDVGDLTQARQLIAGQSSKISGYSSGGIGPSIILDTIDKFPFTNNANATDVGNLIQPRNGSAGQSSQVSGYTSGGTGDFGRTSTLDKFPFATDTNATYIGDLTGSRNGLAGISGLTHGYTTGGRDPSVPDFPLFVKTIDKFPFSADGNATNVGNLLATGGAYQATGHSSIVSGYTSGGNDWDLGVVTRIEKFPFANETTSTSVGNITVARQSLASQQY